MATSQHNDFDNIILFSRKCRRSVRCAEEVNDKDVDRAQAHLQLYQHGGYRQGNTLFLYAAIEYLHRAAGLDPLVGASRRSQCAC